MECNICKWHNDADDICRNPKNKDKLTTIEQRKLGKLSQMWYKSCGIAGNWHESAYTKPVIPVRPLKPKPDQIPGLVKFNDGSFAIRKGKEGAYKYLDLESPACWWSKEHSYFIRGDCTGSKNKILKALQQIKTDKEYKSDYGEPV